MEHISEELKRHQPRNSKTASASHSLGEEVCRLCYGAGVVYPLNGDGKPDYSRVVPCKCAENGLKRRMAENLLKYCQLPEGAGGMTLENFRKKFVVGNTNKEAYELAVNLSNESGLKWLTLIGKVDTGKTFLAVAICREWLKREKPARYAYVPLLLDELRRGFNLDGEEAYENRFDFFCRVPLLVLDDLGVQKTTDFAMEKLNTIVDYRYMHALPLVVTMNNRIDEIPGDSERRIASRLQRFQDSKVVVLEGGEYRLRREK